MIQLIHLDKTYSAAAGDVVALEDINLTIEDGAIYGIIGLSGAGKSTLVRCINLLEKPTAGQVLVDGEDLTKVKKRRLYEIRRNIGMIFQGFNLLEQRNVAANVRFPLELARVRKTVEVKRKRKTPEGKVEIYEEDKLVRRKRKVPEIKKEIYFEPKLIKRKRKNPDGTVEVYTEPKTVKRKRKGKDGKKEIYTEPLLVKRVRKVPEIKTEIYYEPKLIKRKRKNPDGTVEFYTEPKMVKRKRIGKDGKKEVYTEPLLVKHVRKIPEVKTEIYYEPKVKYVRYKREEMKARVAELLELVGLSEKAKAYPSQLSGGQKQRVAIARALALNPKYLLCDEATSALDPNTTTSILELLKEINRKLGVTIIVITHEMRVVDSICTDVAVIDQSRIVESGKVASVFAFPQSEIAKQLIIPELIRTVKSTGGSKLRLVFNGEEADTPVVSGLAIEYGIAVNILYADTKNIDGKMYGHMVITLPEDEGQAAKVKQYLEKNNVKYKEEI